MFLVVDPVVPTLAVGSPPDLLRLLAVPVFAWAAYHDIRTRRVPNKTWVPLVALGVVLMAWDAWLVMDTPTYERQLFVIRVAASLGIVAPLGYFFWRLGGFGGADAKAIMTLALLFPAYPVYYLPWGAWPVVRANLGVFSLTVLSNTVVLGVLYPAVLAARNALAGRVASAMFVGRPVPVERVPEEYGRLLETPDGFTRRGLDIDALRMYLRWRGARLPEVRAAPDQFRDSRTLPAESDRNDPGDGSLAGAPVTDGGRDASTHERDVLDRDRPWEGDNSAAPDESGGDSEIATPDEPIPAVRPADPWGAATFLESIEGDAYGTTPEQLRAGLEVLACEDEVWITPGIPFVVPMFAGLVVALTFGDLLFAGLQAIGLAA